MTTLTMWIDAGRCTGCGRCVEACARGAISLIDGKARIDEATCTGCEACVEVCPEAAIQPVIQGEMVPAPERPAPSVRQTSPLVETAGAAVVVAGTSLLMRAARGAVQALGRWLMNRPLTTSSASNAISRRSGNNRQPGRSAQGGARGRRARRRHRGG
jgi:NAD-dependent dihydropyrimidine dehydrogenase PreA subunit